jgi:type IV secretory pathway protease TraF
MKPTLNEGQIVYGLKYKKPRLKTVVIASVGGREIIKRVAKIDGDKLYIVGDNALHSKDSRDFGWIANSSVLATVVWPKNL